VERRTFLSRIVSFFSLALAALFSLPIFKYLSESLSEQGDTGWYRLIRTDAAELSDEVTLVRLKKILREGWHTRIVEENVWVRKKSDGSFLVFNTHCTHLGCSVSWDASKKQFACPCHGGRYDVDGYRTAGPPPRPLDRYETRIDNNTLIIGKILKS
jgi:menaquinol-cytochrome c reductase iron-sulfur subunit